MSSPSQRTRHREQRETTRQTIIAATQRLLRERPYRELSVEAVMAETSFTRTAFYRHFDDTTDLVLRVLGELARELFEVAERWRGRAGYDYPESAYEGLEAIVEFFVSNGPLARSVAEAAVSDEQIERAYRGFLEGFIAVTKQALDSLVERGRLSVPDTLAMARALNLMNEAYLLDEFGREPIGDPELALATLKTVWLRVLGPDTQTEP